MREYPKWFNCLTLKTLSNVVASNQMPPDEKESLTEMYSYTEHMTQACKNEAGEPVDPFLRYKLPEGKTYMTEFLPKSLADKDG